MLCNREQWGNSVQLVGHDGTVVASRYSPCVFSAPEGTQNNKRGGAEGDGDVARVCSFCDPKLSQTCPFHTSAIASASVCQVMCTTSTAANVCLRAQAIPRT